MKLPQQVTIKKDKRLATVINIERGVKPELYYCWNVELGIGEWLNRSEFKILGEKKPKPKKDFNWYVKRIEEKEKKRKNPLQTAEDYLIG